MELLTNGDFSSGLSDWAVTQGGPTAPAFDAATGGIIFGFGNNDVQNSDSISQQVELTTGEEFTFTLTLSEVGPDVAFGGGGLTIDLVDAAGSGVTNLGSVTVGHEETTTVTFTFTSPYDAADLVIRGQFAFGTADNFLLLDDISLTGASLPCFVQGTKISTPTGPKVIDGLKAGDLVNTVDDGPQEIKWIGKRSVTLGGAATNSKLRPIVIRAGALGPGVPNVDMRVSRQHRLLVSSAIAERMFGMPQVLVPAVRLLDLPNVEIDMEVQKIDYLHLMFDRHQVIWADGAPTESFFFDIHGVQSLPRDMRQEIEMLFPELVSGEKTYQPARVIPLGKRQKKLVERHVINRRHLLSDRSFGLM